MGLVDVDGEVDGVVVDEDEARNLEIVEEFDLIEDFSLKGLLLIVWLLKCD